MTTEAERALQQENEALRLRLEEAEQTLEAIGKGEVDSLLVDGPDGPWVYTLEGATSSYRTLVEAMSEGAATLSDLGVILYCNRKFAQMLGAPLHQVMGGAIQACVSPRDRAMLEALIQRAVADEAGESKGELSLRARSGEDLPAYLSLRAVHDGGRRVLCLVATDLSEQKRGEEIVGSERLARSVLEQVAESMVVCDARGRIIRASDACAQLCGRNPLFLPFREAFPLEVSAPIQGDVATAALRGAVLRAAPAALLRPDGARSSVLVSATALRGADAELVGCVVGLVDVTDLRHAEDALREANQQLREADRRKDDFLGMLSHELRNPLGPIRHSIHILQRVQPASEQGTRAFQVIERQVGHLSRIVDDLLDVTRISRGKIDLRRAPADLRELVLRAGDDFRPMLHLRGVSLLVELPREEVTVDLDATRISQVVGNLLQNAARYTQRGDEVTLSLTVTGAHAELAVQDTGAGIEPSLLPRIFEAFVQGERSLARSEGGLGLGLALVKGIAELHGGSVRVESAGVGMGAKFVVRLPLAPAAAEEASPRPLVRVAVVPRRVLVVDDNRDAAGSLAELIELLGHSVAVAYDGPTAVELAQTNRPDVVLCDLGLPGMSGYDVARALRGSACGSRLFALSGYAQPEDVKRALSAGFDGHLAKPARAEDIERLLV